MSQGAGSRKFGFDGVFDSGTTQEQVQSNASGLSGSMPVGWKCYSRDGQQYFYNPATRTTQWAPPLLRCRRT